MEENRILRENEKQADKIVAKVMGTTFLIFTLVYLLNVWDVFVIKQEIMTMAFFFSSILLVFPSMLTYLLKIEEGYVKYINVISAALFVTLLSITLTYHVVVIYVYPIAIASLYFSKRLNIVATILTVIGVSAGQLLAFYIKTLQDDNFTVLHDTVLWGIVPRAIVLIAVAVIFTMLCSRTVALLRDRTKAAEELRNRGYYKEILTKDYVKDLYMAAPMHNIGKISVPDVILQKPGRLTEEEFEIIKHHTEDGGRIVKDTFGHLENEQYTEMAYNVARFHHEKWNGMPLERCFEIILEGSGQDFEPVLVEVFLDIRDKVEQIHKNFERRKI